LFRVIEKEGSYELREYSSCIVVEARVTAGFEDAGSVASQRLFRYIDYGFGLALGYHINDNLGLTFSYKSTASDQAPDDLQMDVFMISLVSGWHPIIEGSKRLKSK
jgi:hypothetical protein